MARRKPPENVPQLIENEEFQRKMENLKYLAGQQQQKPK